MDGFENAASSVSKCAAIGGLIGGLYAGLIIFFDTPDLLALEQRTDSDGINFLYAVLGSGVGFVYGHFRDKFETNAGIVGGVVAALIASVFVVLMFRT